MGLWNGFTSAISSIASGAGAQLKSLTGGGAYLSEDEKKKEAALHETVKSALSSIGDVAAHVPGHTIAKDVAKKSADVLLHTAMYAQEKVLSPYIFRPISTVALLTDPTSALYKKGQYEEGFQFADIKAAYNRSAKVSSFQALTKSALIPGMTELSGAILSTGHIDINEVDLWNDQSIKQNYVDNAVGRWFTGIGDLAVGSAVFGGVGKGVGLVAKAGGAKVGLYTARKTVEELAVDMETGIKHAMTNGAEGTQTVSGSHMVVLAESKDYGVISDLVEKYSTNGKLVQLIHDASNPTAVKDLILADKGNLAAMERLAATAPDDLFDLSDTAAQLTNRFIQTGKAYTPDSVAAPRLKAAYDAAIKKDPQYVKIREAFLDDNYNPLVGGKAFMPKEPIIGKGAILKGQQVARDIKGKVRFREFDDSGFFLSTKIGNRVVTEVVKQVGTKMPNGHVTFSGLRPFDGRIELNAFLDNVKLFSDGSKLVEVAPRVFKKAADVRREFEAKYMSSIGVNQVAALEEIDAQIGRMIGFKAGIYSEAEMKQYVSGFRANINKGLDSIKSNGFAIGHDGRRIETNAQTIRQLEESYRFTPWDSIETKLDRVLEESTVKLGAKRTYDAGRQVFTDLNRLWTFDVLVRPMYMIKQSIAEPLVSATISQGQSFLWKDIIGNPLRTDSMLGRTFRNSGHWITKKATGPFVRGEKKAINKFVTDNKKMLIEASHNKDILQAEVESILKYGSPAVKKSALVAANKELAAAERLLEKIELDIRKAVVPYGAAEATPSLTMLQRRVDFIKSKPAIGKANAAKLAEAQKAIANYKNVISKMATNGKVIRDADKALAKAYDEIDNVVSKLKPALSKQADVFGKSQKFKNDYYAKDSQIRVLDNGEVVTIDSLVSGNTPFSAATRAETANARTADLTYLGEMSVGTRQRVLRRKVPPTTIKVTSAEYFAELEHIANRIIRQDPLMDQILAGKSIKELTQWAKSEQGMRYLEHFDIYEAKQVPAYLADKVALIERTFPSLEARAAILEREVTATELQSWLGSKVDELYDITPTNFAYGVADAGLGANPYGVVSNWLNQNTARIFRRMSSVENPIRNAMFDKMAIDNMAVKANALIEQGVKMTPAQWNALRQSSSREALQELEKTVYTVRRENRLLHNARLLTAFPTATLNAFVRYGRLAVKQPARSAGFMYNYGRMFNNFGVDENGNPTTDYNEITHIIIPATKELGMGYMGEGVALNARSVGFLLNMPSPSFITSLSVGKLMETFPGTEDGIRSIMDSTGVLSFDTVFPYGAPTSITKAFTPPWANSLWNAANGPEGKADYLASWTSVYNYHKMLVEMGVEDAFPSDAQIRDEVKGMWADKFLSGFASIAGVPYKTETNPMRLSTNLYYKLLEKNRKNPDMSEQQARDAAGDEMLATMGPGFNIDRITATSNNRNVNIPATYESYKRVFNDNDALVGKLAAIDPDSVGIVGLLTADLSRDPAEQSSNILNILRNPDLTLPGTSKKINNLKMTPQEAEAERIKNRTWQQYGLAREALEAKITDGRTLRSHPELKAVLDQLAMTTFKEQSPEWFDEFQLSASGDKSYKYAKAFQTITTDKNFMAKSGTSQFWKDAKFFIETRTIIAAFYQSLPDYDTRKADIKDKYNDWVQQNSKQWDPNFETLVKNYFENDTLKAVE